MIEWISWSRSFRRVGKKGGVHVRVTPVTRAHVTKDGIKALCGLAVGESVRVDSALPHCRICEYRLIERLAEIEGT